jgi:hypothetical protein
MPVRVTCPFCSTEFDAPSPPTGQNTHCPSCSEPVPVGSAPPLPSPARRVPGKLVVPIVLGGCVLLSVLSFWWIKWSGEPLRRHPQPLPPINTTPAAPSGPAR